MRLTLTAGREEEQEASARGEQTARRDCRTATQTGMLAATFMDAENLANHTQVRTRKS